MLRVINDQYSWLILLMLIFLVESKAEYNELKMVHVIFRHGERTPSEFTSEEKYPKDPYLNKISFPEGSGGLTNNGKLTMYNLGSFLRREYNKFLGDFYYPEVVKVRSTQSPRAMMSAQLVNAGLWPPPEAQRWNKDLLWIPIPYEYGTSDPDILMWSYKCPTYKAEYARILQSEEVQRLVEPHLEFFAYLSEHTGLNITRPREVFFLYHTLQSEFNSNWTLPSWTHGYFPNGEIYDVTLLEYDISTWGNLLRRIYGGPLLRDILQDYKKFIKDTSSGEFSPKIKLYSGHESNICSVMKALGIWTPHVPDFGSALIFELYLNNSTNEFGIQILYHPDKSEGKIPLTLTGCMQICPMKKFTELLSNVIPEDDEEVCGMKIESIKNLSSAISLQTCTLYIILQIWILIK